LAVRAKQVPLRQTFYSRAYVKVGRAIATAAVAFLALTHCARRPATESPDAARARAFSSVLHLNGGPHRGGSGVRVADGLVLTAAHCVLGLDGAQPVSSFTTRVAGAEYRLDVAETADFAPALGRMTDFAVLSATDVAASVPVAQLATADELRAAESVGDGLLEKSVEVWVAGYSTKSARAPPREAIPGQQLFASQGWLKSRSAFRLATYLAVKQGFILDDRFGPPPAAVTFGDLEWQSLSETGPHVLYENYAAAGAPLFYHSADYAPGASGGGVFLANGHLLGIIPLGTTAGSRVQGYQGFGQAFRVDVICRKSKVLAAVPGCAAFR
jgi:hypothetical protein